MQMPTETTGLFLEKLALDRNLFVATEHYEDLDQSHHTSDLQSKANIERKEGARNKISGWHEVI